VARAIPAAHEPTDAAFVLLDPDKTGAAEGEASGLHQWLDQEDRAQWNPKKQKTVRSAISLTGNFESCSSGVQR
jgi:hypothetical protein